MMNNQLKPKEKLKKNYSGLLLSICLFLMLFGLAYPLVALFLMGFMVISFIAEYNNEIESHNRDNR